jgi:hypothetical protein
VAQVRDRSSGLVVGLAVTISYYFKTALSNHLGFGIRAKYAIRAALKALAGKNVSLLLTNPDGLFIPLTI